MKRLTREEYIAKAMLLDMEYMPVSHTFITGEEYPRHNTRFDPDTLEVVSSSGEELAERMTQVERGEIGCIPPFIYVRERF